MANSAMKNQINQLSKHRSMNGLLNHQLYKLIFLLIYHLYRIDAIKVDGFSEYTGVAGGPLLLPCNTSNGASWTSHVTMVLFYKGVNGKPLFTMNKQLDQRNLTLPISQSPNTHHNYPRRIKPTEISSNRASLISSNSFYYDQALSTPVYFIESLRESDEGEYRCRIDYKQSRTRNYVIKLNVIVPPKENIIMNSDGQILDNKVGPIEENDDISLVCEAFAKPAPTVMWYFDDQLIDDSFFSEQRGLSRNELQLNHLNRSHLNSQLTCKSQNSNLTKATQTTLTIDFILKPLQIKIISDKKFLESGQESTFQCIVYGARPQPSISWSLVDDISTDSNVNNQDFIENDLSSSSFYQETNWYKDFTIDKSQIIKNQTNSIQNKTQERLKQQINSKLNSLINLNNNVNSNELSSFLSAQKTAIIQVLSESENIHSSQIRFRLNEKFNNKHLICRAENFRLKGSQQSSAVLQENFHLQIQYKPIVKLKLGASLNANRLRETSDLYLDCVTDSNPPTLSVKFLKDSQPIQPETGVILSNQTLVLQQVKRRMRGYYSCEASNSIGKSQSNDLFLRIQYAPVCSSNLIQTKSVPRNGQVEMVCEVFSDPSVTAFRWYLNNSSETIEITSNTAIFNQTILKPTIASNQMSLSINNKTTNLNNFYKINNYYPQSFTNNLSQNLDLLNYNNQQSKLGHDDLQMMFISIGRFSPSSRFDFGTIFCKAENQISIQQDPCTFHLLKAGPPSRLNDCHVSNHSLTSLVVFCSNNLINLDHHKYSSSINSNKYANSQSSNNVQQPTVAINSAAQQYTAHHIHTSNALLNYQNENTRNNLFMAIVYEDAHNEQLILNLTRKQPHFVLNNLKPATQYSVLLYAINDQGKSQAHRLVTSTLGPPEKRQMSQSSLNDETIIDLSLKQNWLAVISATLAILILVISFVIRCMIRSRRTLSQSNFNINKSEPDIIQHNQNLKLSTNKGNTSTPTNNGDNQLLKNICKTNELDSKDDMICTSNQDDFVSEYKISWENESFKRFENTGNSIYQPTIDVIAYELDSGLGSTRTTNSAFNRLNGTIKNSNQINSSLYNAFNQLNNDEQLLNEQQLNTHFNLSSIHQNTPSNLNSSNISTTSTNTSTTTLLPLQLHQNNLINNQRNLDTQLLTSDTNSYTANTFHQQQLNQLHSNHQTHLTNSTDSSINSSTINLTANLNSLGMSSINNLNELYHLKMFNSNYANDPNYQLQTGSITLDNLYATTQNHSDGCNFTETSLSMYQQQIAMHLLNNNLNSNLINNLNNNLTNNNLNNNLNGNTNQQQNNQPICTTKSIQDQLNS